MEEKKEFNHLVRIANTDLDGNKKLGYALTKIKGIGYQFANMICKISNIDKKSKIGYLSDEDIKKIDLVIKSPIKSGAPIWMLNRRKDYEDGSNRHIITTDLMFIKDNDLKRMKKIKSYRGMRHAFGLPVRGQKTKSNFRRQKGKGLGVKKKTQRKKGK